MLLQITSKLQQLKSILFMIKGRLLFCFYNNSTHPIGFIVDEHQPTNGHHGQSCCFDQLTVYSSLESAYDGVFAFSWTTGFCAYEQQNKR